MHRSFIDNLINNYKLTSNEIRLASMMKMNMTSKEMNLLDLRHLVVPVLDGLTKRMVRAVRHAWV